MVYNYYYKKEKLKQENNKEDETTFLNDGGLLRTLFILIQIEEENKSSDEMDKSHSAEPKIEVCFSSSHESRWIANHITRNAQCKYTESIDPMINADR